MFMKYSSFPDVRDDPVWLAEQENQITNSLSTIYFVHCAVAIFALSAIVNLYFCNFTFTQYIQYKFTFCMCRVSSEQCVYIYVNGRPTVPVPHKMGKILECCV